MGSPAPLPPFISCLAAAEPGRSCLAHLSCVSFCACCPVLPVWPHVTWWVPWQKLMAQHMPTHLSLSGAPMHRAGGDAVHLLPAGGRAATAGAQRGDHLRPGAHHDCAAGAVPVSAELQDGLPYLSRSRVLNKACIIPPVELGTASKHYHHLHYSILADAVWACQSH